MMRLKPRAMLGRYGVQTVVVAAVLWVIIVFLSGMGFNLLRIDWNFERTGQLGDSFGVLSSAMAAIAAYFAFSTYRSARDEGQQAEQRAFQTAYLNLLERRFDVLDRIRTQNT